MKTMASLVHCMRGAALIAAAVTLVSMGSGLGGAARAQDAPQSSAARAPAATGPFILMDQMHVKPEREKDFLKLMAQMTHRAKTQDRGNIRYDLYAVAPTPNAAAGATPAANYVFLEEWRDQAAATAHGKWAGPIVRTQWREMTDSMQIMRLSRVPAH